MAYIDKTCREFVEAAGSSRPVPGGGSVAALVGALGASLGAMVAALTEERKDREAKKLEAEIACAGTGAQAAGATATAEAGVAMTGTGAQAVGATATGEADVAMIGTGVQAAGATTTAEAGNRAAVSTSTVKSADWTAVDEIREIQESLLQLVQADIEIFEPLSRLYGKKSNDPVEKQKIKEARQKALYEACLVPMKIVDKCGRAIELARGFAVEGNRVVISDAGASAVLSKAAMQAASLNVYINTNMMTDKQLAVKLSSECSEKVARYAALADSVFDYVKDTIANAR